MDNEESGKKWEITPDMLMIIGKYFKTNTDFTNVMKVCKKYNKLVERYHFNPIGDTSLFINMQTQHFYSCEDYREVNITKSKNGKILELSFVKEVRYVSICVLVL